LKQIPRLPGYALVTTNTIPRIATRTTLRTRVQLRPTNELLAPRVHPALYRPRPALVRQPLRVAKARAVVKPAWASPLREEFIEKVLYAAMALSAAAGIAYVFLSVLERVQNWPLFNAWVLRVLGA
jgi:hypothetical protein